MDLFVMKRFMQVSFFCKWWRFVLWRRTEVIAAIQASKRIDCFFVFGIIRHSVKTVGDKTTLQSVLTK